MRIAHLADFHLPSDPAGLLYGIRPHAHLCAAVRVLQSLRPQPDLIIIGGDIFHDGTGANYGPLGAAFSGLKQPVHLVMGNHDCLATYRRTAQPPLALDFPGYYSFDLGGYHIVLLHSAGTGRGYGLLDEAQLHWLDRDLARSHPQPLLVFAHHPPLKIGVPWLDSINLRNMDDFWAVAGPHKGRLRAVLVAHLHLQATCMRDDVPVASCPATSWQFSGRSDAARAQRTGEQPGFNLLDLDGEQMTIRTVRFEPSDVLDGIMGGER